jgi:hypothetical protein
MIVFLRLKREKERDAYSAPAQVSEPRAQGKQIAPNRGTDDGNDRDGAGCE